jgi:nucleotide-binding universal stress UspA family protein
MEAVMELRHIVVATDESDAGRRAVRAGIQLAHRAGARVTVMRAVTVSATPALAAVGSDSGSEAIDYSAAPLQELERWLEPELDRLPEGLRLDLGIALGAPAIEISRFAEDQGADLLVLGRKQRSQLGRLLLGDTADAVARRSRIPCIFVSRNSTSLTRTLVALDGTPRGNSVLRAAVAFAEQTGARMRAVTVEPEWAGEPGHLSANVPATRSETLRSEIEELLDEDRLRRIGWPGVRRAGDLLERRRGDTVEQVLLAADVSNAEVLIFGFHRGGPPGIIEARSTARRLAHTAPCAVLTIPL